VLRTSSFTSSSPFSTIEDDYKRFRKFRRAYFEEEEEVKEQRNERTAENLQQKEDDKDDLRDTPPPFYPHQLIVAPHAKVEIPIPSYVESSDSSMSFSVVRQPTKTDELHLNKKFGDLSKIRVKNRAMWDQPAYDYSLSRLTGDDPLDFRNTTFQELFDERGLNLVYDMGWKSMFKTFIPRRMRKKSDRVRKSFKKKLLYRVLAKPMKVSGHN